jgi:hypothetical protein
VAQARNLILATAIAAMLGTTLPASARDTGEWLCEPLIRAAEREEEIPAGLLLAIGRAESGVMTDRGKIVWPWALNIAGRSVIPETRAEALAEIRRALAEAPRRPIDIGCMQINWQHHQRWFSDPAQLLEPAWNVAYGARFLRNLAAAHGAWQSAVGYYHSANPQRQTVYLASVARQYCAGQGSANACALAPRAAATGPVRATSIKIYRADRPPELIETSARSKMIRIAPN